MTPPPESRPSDCLVNVTITPNLPIRIYRHTKCYLATDPTVQHLPVCIGYCPCILLQRPNCFFLTIETNENVVKTILNKPKTIDFEQQNPFLLLGSGIVKLAAPTIFFQKTNYKNRNKRKFYRNNTK